MSNLFTRICSDCGQKYVDGKCNCITFVAHNMHDPSTEPLLFVQGEEPEFFKIFERALLAYDHHNERNNTEHPMSGRHHTGNCFIFFRGRKAMLEAMMDYHDEIKDDFREIDT